METFCCIYCKNEYEISKASISDIIPYALLGGKKLQLKNKVCESCNKLVNKNCEEDIIKKFESLRRRINPVTRRGKPLNNQYVIKFCNDGMEVKTNYIKTNNIQKVLEGPIYYEDKSKKGIFIGPYDKVATIAAKKDESQKVRLVDNVQDKLSVVETFPILIEDFFSNNMKTMVAKICYEWMISICTESKYYDFEMISSAIYENAISEFNIVDVLTNVDIAKSLFEDLSNHRNEELKEFELVPKKLIVGDYLLFFEIKNNKLYCFLAFMGMVLYRVLITTENLPINKNILVSKIYKYSGRTGEQEISNPHPDNWPKLSYNLGLSENYNQSYKYRDYLKTKLLEIIQFKVEA